MALPELDPLPVGTVTIKGTDVPIRSLSRTEFVHLQSFDGNEDEAEPYIVACATGITVDDARAWLATADFVTGGKIIEAILRLTGASNPQAGSTGEGPSERPSSEP